MSSLCRRRARSSFDGRMVRAALFGLALAASSLASCARQRDSTQSQSAQSTQPSQSQTQSQQPAEVLLTKSPRETRVLRVCADPNNMPFSNERGEGFENRIVETLAKDLGARV